MAVFELDPLKDKRWGDLVDSHPHAAVFHTPQWLQALSRTYGYRPFVFTTCDEGVPLTNGIVFCGVESWLAGSKWVSLPFSDHCEPLVDSQPELQKLLSDIANRKPGNLKYVEIRPRTVETISTPEWAAQAQYWLHILDLRPELDEIYSRFHKDSIQRKIRRADREGVVLVQGRSDLLLREFYNLLILTRRRHRVPPQPFAWFQNLTASFGDRLTLRVARAGGRPIASILTLRHQNTVTYKYGCSDEQYHPLGGMARLFWQAIREAKAEGVLELDLGRTDLDNEGLIRFKDRLGAAKTLITYRQFGSKPSHSEGPLTRYIKSSMIQTVISRLPAPLFRIVGEVLYRHAG
jgi:hypothetical protein